MMLAPRQVFLLSEMGIPVWEMRGNLREKAEASIDVDIAEPVDRDAVLAKIEAATSLICLDSALTQQTQRLLESIYRAMAIPITMACFLTPSELEVIESVLFPNAEQKHLLTFGESISQQLFGPSATVEQYHANVQFTLASKLATWVNVSLDQVLEKPELKKKIWQNLQHVKQQA